MTEAVRAMAGWLTREDGFTLISHVSPDGDTFGSALALYAILRVLHKRAQVVCEQPVPRIYAFLPNAADVKTPGAAERLPFAIAIDCADPARMGSAQALFDAARETGNIDHHRTNPLYGDHVLHDGEAAATGELVYALWEALGAARGGEAAREIAACLYTAISTDTGNFAYSNTTPNTFLVAAGLLQTGIELAELNRRLYRMVPLGKTRLLGYVLSHMRLYHGSEIGLSSVSQSMLDELGATQEDAEGVIDNIRDIDTVEIAVLIREAKDGSYKVSMRAKERADVSAIARRLGGGGHLRAAGCTYVGDLETLTAELLRLAEAALA